MMWRIAPLATLALLGACDQGDGGTLPASGLDVTVHEVVIEQQPFSNDVFLVMRFLAPDLGTSNAPPLEDMQWACEQWGLREATTLSPPPTRIVVELMVRPPPRGEPNPAVVRVFEAFQPVDDTCVWVFF